MDSADNDRWIVVPDEAPEGAPLSANARDGKYVQSRLESTGGLESLGGSTTEYLMQISTPGTYNLYLRWDGSPGSEGTNQEVAADIAELKDGPGGTIADWYRASMLGDADFASDPWDGDGGFEPDAVVAAEGPMTWDMSEPGAYTLRLSQLTAGPQSMPLLFKSPAFRSPPEMARGPQHFRSEEKSLSPTTNGL